MQSEWCETVNSNDVSKEKQTNFSIFVCKHISEIFQHFLLDRLFSLVFSFNNLEYIMFLILCRIRQKSIFEKCDSESAQYLQLDCVKMSHSEAIVVMIIL